MTSSSSAAARPDRRPRPCSRSTDCKVGLFEREQFPRFHIGESLIPETYWVLKRLNMLPKMQQSHFVKKYSVQFVNANGKLSAPFYFWDNKPHECSQTWQVVRSEFDQMMLDNAREHGVDAHEGVHVLDVLFEGDRAVGVRIAGRGRRAREVRAKVVVDASGQAALLQNRFKLRVWDPVLNKGAIWTYWQGAYRDTGRDEGATMVLQTDDQERLVLVHPAARRHRQRRRRGAVRLPVQGPRRVTSRRITKKSSAARRSRTASAKATRVDRLLRDAATTPTARSRWPATAGCSSATRSASSIRCTRPACCWRCKSGEMAADAIAEGLAKGDTSARRSSGKWGAGFNEGVDRMRRLVCEYYDGFSFGEFVRKYPAPAGHGHRPADRRPVHRPRRQGVGADGVALRAANIARFRPGTQGKTPDEAERQGERARAARRQLDARF